ncbi:MULTISPECIES: SPOR domain-containing protein [Pacificibacter]|uniref:SPOR domain-containing protein n=1 Tax=Pacificibacter TaxID=1042323 RepID=UPI001C096184|nr:MULTISPECIES: SPOR domain-containing protein [Pacificibacter]MBU2935914.1 SPOR domain-containing protein [Pacificibacter marinus]MDO6614409.1 SPOR domain-containing protein [Pacificibacter sp. 1_MG-2023]
MKTIRLISFAVLAATLGVTGLNARTSLQNADEPAEFPPASYKASQYVDSDGCAYVRSGHSGHVTWVPRVSRDRKVLCGFKPSLANAQDSLPVIPDPVLPAGVKAPLATVASTTTLPAKIATSSAKTLFPAAAPVRLAPQATTAAPAAATVSVARKPTPVKAAPVKTAPVKRATLADAEIVGQTCGTNAAGQALRCTATSTQSPDYILKRLPAGITVRKADGGTLTTTEPTLVRVAIHALQPAPVAPTAVLPLPIQAAPKAPAPQYVTAAATPVTSNFTSHCNGLSGNAAQYMRTSSKLAVRCGPQAVHPSAYIQRNAQRVAQANVALSEVSRRGRELGVVYTAPVAVKTPTGYHRAFDDGRLNPNRGPRTLAGDLQQAQVWTNTVPAYPVETGAPPLTFWQQLFGTGPKTVQRTVVYQPSAKVTSSYQDVRVSTKSVAPVSTPVARQAVASGLRYVQVGTFGVPSNAAKSIARLSAMGMPVSSQILNRNGKQLKMVLAGPFASPEQTLQALGQARSVGYSDAFARK